MSPVRAVPPYANREDDESTLNEPPPDEPEPELPSLPQGIHKSKPISRQYDKQRSSEPPIPRHYRYRNPNKWKRFIDETRYPIEDEGPRVLVDEKWMTENGPDFSRPWDEERAAVANVKWKPKRKTRFQAAERTLLRSGFVPLLFRAIVFAFCIIAVGLGGTIWHATSVYTGNAVCKLDPESRKTSPVMAIIVNTIAVVYTLAVTWNEYFAPPIGLRSGSAKVSILLLDLVFIVFSSANLSLAFEGITGWDNQCSNQPELLHVNQKQEALASVLLIVLIAWLSTFSVSVLRVAERGAT